MYDNSVPQAKLFEAETDNKHASRSKKSKTRSSRSKRTEPRRQSTRPGEAEAVSFRHSVDSVAKTLPVLPKAAPKRERRRSSRADAEAAAQQESVLPTAIAEVLGIIQRPRTRPLFWFAGTALLLCALAAQLIYFYRDELAREEGLPRAYLLAACEYFHCEITLPHDVDRIVLTNTVVAPHPEYQNALRIRAMLVNRAEFVQPFPLLEVSLINTRGQIVARRAFTPAQYLKEGTAQADKGMPFNIVQTAQFDLTSPDRRAMGYEIRLYAAQ